MGFRPLGGSNAHFYQNVLPLACSTLASIAGGSAWIMEYHSFHLSQRGLKLAFRHFRGVPANGISGTCFPLIHFILSDSRSRKAGSATLQLLSQNLAVEMKMGKSKEVCESEGHGDLGKFFGPCFCSGSKPKSLKISNPLSSRTFVI